MPGLPSELLDFSDRLIEGYDIDYEDDNKVSYIGKIIAHVRSELDGLKPKRQFSISPATKDYLNKEDLKNIDWINMQTYAGGEWQNVSTWTEYGFPAKRLFWGKCTEDATDPTKAHNMIDDAIQKATENKLAGVHTWRLNSDNYKIEDEAQTYLAKKIRAL